MKKCNIIVVSKILLILVLIVIAGAFSGCGKNQAIQECEAKIQSIGTVSLESEKAILIAEDAYKILSEDEKVQLGDNIQVLVHKRVEFDQLVLDTNKRKVAQESQSRVDNVVDLIDSIGTVSLESHNSISNAQKAFEMLDADEQAKVSNYGKLEEASDTYRDLKDTAKYEAIEMYKGNFDIEEDVVDGITWYYPKQRPKYIDERCFVMPAIGIRDNNAWICVAYNYTEDNWIFWEKMIFVVDGERFTKDCSQIQRSSGYGRVSETYQEALNLGQSMDSEEILLLNKIVNSERTIIRFDGDNSHYDYEVVQIDKDMLNDVIALYSAFAD